MTEDVRFSYQIRKRNEHHNRAAIAHAVCPFLFMPVIRIENSDSSVLFDKNLPRDEIVYHHDRRGADL